MPGCENSKIIKDAEGYANEKIPEARGKVSSIVSQAEASSQEVLDFVEGRVNAFNSLLVEYQKSPEITTKLQYLDALQTISRRSRVTIDADSSQSLYYIAK